MARLPLRLFTCRRFPAAPPRSSRPNLDGVANGHYALGALYTGPAPKALGLGIGSLSGQAPPPPPLRLRPVAPRVYMPPLVEAL